VNYDKPGPFFYAGYCTLPGLYDAMVMLILTGPAERVRGKVFSQIRDFILLEWMEGGLVFGAELFENFWYVGRIHRLRN